MEGAARAGPLEVTKAKKRLISQPNGRKLNLPTITATANPIISNGNDPFAGLSVPMKYSFE
jgi:hypothetical protein